MTNNCLVKKIKGVIINDNLPVLGYVKVKVPVGSGNSFIINLSEQETAIALNGTWVLTGTKENTTNVHYINASAFNLTNPSDEYYEVLVPKYHITGFTIIGAGSCNIDDFKASESSSISMNVTSTTAGQVIIKGTADGFAEKLGGNVTLKRAATFETPFDCTNIGKSGLLTTFNIAQASNVFGSLVNLAYSNSLTTFNGNDNNSFVCEDYVAIKRNLGYTTGSVSIPYLGAMQSTFNGQPIVSQSSNTLSWTATTITLNDVTIDA